MDAIAFSGVRGKGLVQTLTGGLRLLGAECDHHAARRRGDLPLQFTQQHRREGDLGNTAADEVAPVADALADPTLPLDFAEVCTARFPGAVALVAVRIQEDVEHLAS